jgi:carbamoyl-phosphate synthase large subunit
VPRSALAHSWRRRIQVQAQIGFPCIIRPSFTLGGTGGGIAYNREEFEEICQRGLDLSPDLRSADRGIGPRLEGVRDGGGARQQGQLHHRLLHREPRPMGVHTGDSITVAPAQTLTDKEYQIMRDASLAVLREIGVETGGSNVQFAVNPADGRMVVIEMNPRVSRSSALASKATGFPSPRSPPSWRSATRWTSCATTSPAAKPRPRSSRRSTTWSPRSRASRSRSSPAPTTRLTTQMKSVGEVMAIGRTFQESLQKALRGLETGKHRLDESSVRRPEGPR